MQQWEYFFIYIRLLSRKDSANKKYMDWVQELSDGTTIEGMERILDGWGLCGWELVNLVVAHTSIGSQGSGVDCYRAVFKRRLGSE